LTQIGYYGFVTEHLSDVLSDNTHDFSFFLPSGVTAVYDPTVQQNLVNWVQSEGENMIFIYGGRDAWTGAAIDIAGNANLITITEPGADHFVDISDLTERETVYTALEQWLDISVNRTAVTAKPDKTEIDMMPRVRPDW
jgi:hypothetical protein